MSSFGLAQHISAKTNKNYLSVYRNVLKPLKLVGDLVKAGESIAIMGEDNLWFELWQDGKSINPEQVIAF